MPNKTFTQICELMHNKNNMKYNNLQEILIRQKVDGVSCLLILSLCKHNPRDSVFITEHMRQQCKADPKKVQNPMKMCRNAWHPYYVDMSGDVIHDDPGVLRRTSGLVHGWFHVHIVTSFGFEQAMSEHKVCKYRPLYLPDIVLFQLHRDIAGWSGLKGIFDNISKKENTKKVTSGQLMKMLVFRCELALPGLKAHAVTTGIVKSWIGESQNISQARRNSKSKNPEPKMDMSESEDDELIDDDPDSVNETPANVSRVEHARKNFQIYILSCVFEMEPVFVREMLHGFWTRTQHTFRQSMDYNNHLFSRNEFIQALLSTTQTIVEFSNQQTKEAQDAFFVETLIKANEGNKYGCFTHDWNELKGDGIVKRDGTKGGVIVVCESHSRGHYDLWQCLNGVSQSHRGNQDQDVHMPVITTPMIFLHHVNYLQLIKNKEGVVDASKCSVLNLNDAQCIRSCADRISLLCQHSNFEGAVVSCLYTDDKGKQCTGNFKLKENCVSVCMPYLACDPKAAAVSNPGEWYDTRGVTSHLFPMYGSETTVPTIHIKCYDETRRLALDEENIIKRTIKASPELTSKASLAVTSELGVTHSASRITWQCKDGSWREHFDSDSYSKITRMPLLLVSGNFENGRQTPAILNSLQEASNQNKRATAILQEKARFLYRQNVFAVDRCMKLLTDTGTLGFIQQDTLQFNPADENDLKISSFRDIWETDYCKNVLQNVYTTMFLLLHMRLMLNLIQTDDICKQNLRSIWFNASKVLKQMFCTNLKFSTIYGEQSQAQCRPATWPYFKFLYEQLQACTCLDEIHKTLSSDKFNQNLQKYQKQQYDIILAKCDETTANRICGEFAEKCKQYTFYVLDVKTKNEQYQEQQAVEQRSKRRKKNEDEFEIKTLADGLVNLLQTSDEQRAALEQYYKKSSSATQSLMSELNAHDGQDKIYTRDMITKWQNIRKLCKTDAEVDEYMQYFEPCYDYFNEFKNSPNNSLATFFQFMHYKYTLFSSLHGVLAAKSDIFEFDPFFYHELRSAARQSRDGPLIQILANIKCLLSSSHDEYAAQDQYLDSVLREQSQMEGQMKAFYQARCSRETPAPSNWADLTMPTINAFGVEYVCKVFANWHFGDLSDETRVESKQLK